VTLSICIISVSVNEGDIDYAYIPFIRNSGSFVKGERRSPWHSKDIKAIRLLGERERLRWGIAGLTEISPLMKSPVLTHFPPNPMEVLWWVLGAN